MNGILFVKKSAVSLGGIQGQILRLADELYKKRVFRPFLATTDIKSSFAEEFRKKGWQVFQVSIAKKDIFRTARHLLPIIKQHNIKIVQSHMFRESLIGRCIKYYDRDIVHTYRAHIYIDCMGYTFLRRKAHHLFDKITSRYVDAYIANGPLVAEEIRNQSWVSNGRVKEVINGRPALGEPDAFVDKPEDPLPQKIALVSNLLPGKGHVLLMRCLKLLREKGLELHLRLIGDDLTGSRYGKYENFASYLKHKVKEYALDDLVEFHGHTTDVYQALKGYPVVVLPSDSEGIPNSILEAMSVRKLIISTAVGGIPLMIDDEKEGILVEKQSLIQLSDALQRVFTTSSGDWELLRDNAYEKWKSDFNMETMFGKLLSLYRDLGILG